MERCLVSPLGVLFFILIIHSHVLHSTKSTGATSKGPLCHVDEKLALLQLKKSFSIVSYKGSVCDGDVITKSWNESANCCAWEGITCHEATGHVIGLGLSCSSLHGVITSNSSLFLIHHLERLDLSYNHFDGSSIVPQFGRFKNLTHLHLSGSGFAGNVPVEIAHLSNLVYLEIAERRERRIRIEADTFEALARNATKISEIQLSNIDMSSVSITHLMNLSSSITSLEIRSCQLYGKLFVNGLGFPNLGVLDLGHNNLDGPISSSILNLPMLTRLDLSYNYFVGQITKDYNNSAHNFSFHNSSRYLPHLTVLSLNRNLINRTIPSWIYALPSLEFLDLSNNLLIGEISNFRSMRLNSLILANNNLHGNTPISIFLQVAIQELDLSSNKLTLNFNTSISFSVKNLISLKLSSCNLKEFPHFLASSKELDTIDLSNNQLKGSVPKWLLDASKDSLFHLNLSHNFLTHIEPPIMQYLTILDISSNSFSGSLPILSSHVMEVLLFRKNKFEGEIPNSICELIFLTVIDFSHNNLSGKIPHCIWNFSQSLSVVDMQRNQLQGTIPTQFPKENSLRSINLNGNKLEGQIPRSLAHCRNLEVLDLGNNALNDKFPHWLESLPKLQVLVLRSNKFYGSIANPKTEFPFHELRVIDLSFNGFNGSLPIRHLENFNAMMDAQKVELSYMGEDYYHDSVVVTMKGLEIVLVKVLSIFTAIDFSSNNFTGVMPELIGRFKSLKGLNFSHNILIGPIPASLRNLTNLEWLDLASNELEGTIPMELADITMLTFLNLSYNRLEGLIPHGNQFNTFGNNSFIGNKDLCGFPLSEPCSQDSNVKPETPPTLEQDKRSSFTSGLLDWEIVLMGYGSGFLIGVSIGYMALYSNGKLSWLCEKILWEKRQKKSAKAKQTKHGSLIIYESI